MLTRRAFGSVLLVVAWLGIDSVHGYTFDTCSLAKRLLHRHHLDWDQVQTWVCIARWQSNLNTAAVNYDSDGTGYHGMYQISDRYWCGPGNACNLDCARLLDDDLRDDLACMAHIFAEHQRISGNGYSAWTVYGRNCAPAPSMDECFEDAVETHHSVAPVQTKAVVAENKIYDRCELARELRLVHGLPSEQIATWVCIAKHESNYHTSAVGRLNADGSADHGLFQISDIYWCSPNGWACDVRCEQLRDADLTDDVKCVRTIYAEHQRLSGDGFNAWAVYQPYCRHRSAEYIEGCFAEGELDVVRSHKPHKPHGHHANPVASHDPFVGKVYGRCELARELRFQHGLPLDQIATWVCIAKHESLYNTAAVGRLNADGSADHGLFQISDIYWCSLPGAGWKACGLPCLALEDADITDDVQCIRRIHEEHTRLSGDGFRAWAVYEPYCRGRSTTYTEGCFDDEFSVLDNEIERGSFMAATVPYQMTMGKVYERCELALELRNKHNVPLEQIATWVCIAEHESHFNTSAVGRLNGDGSADHGIFQISDLYWCSPPGKGWACGVACADLENDDISDDVQCVRKIYEEHQRLSGDGFNAWTVYPTYCKGKTSRYIEDCFADAKKGVTAATKPESTKATTQKPKPKPTTTSWTQKTSTSKNKFTLSAAHVKPTSSTKTTTTKRPTTTTPRPTTTKRPSTTSKTTKTTPSRSTSSPNKSSTTRKPSTKTTASIFALYLNDYSTKKPTTFYKFPTTPTGKHSQQPATTAKSLQLSTNTAKSYTKSTPAITAKPHQPTANNDTHLAKTTQKPRSLQSTLPSAAHLHDAAVSTRQSSPNRPDLSSTATPSSWTWKSASLSKPSTSNIHPSHTRKPTASTPPANAAASVRTIFDIQSATKSSFDKLFDRFSH